MVKLIRSAKSTIENDDITSVIKVLKKEFLGMGPKVEEFEMSLIRDFKTNIACVVNGTASIQLALQAHGIGKNDEVLVQSLTYLSTFQAISATGAKPISCEINNETFTIDLDDARKRVRKKTKAIILVHFAGGVGNLNDYYKFAEENNLIVIEDAAHAFGSTYKGKLVGSFKTTATFSFDGIKNLTCGEGGCVMSKNKFIIEKIKDLRVLGIENKKKLTNKNLILKEFEVRDQGWRYHMSDIMASIGLSQYQRFDKIKKKRRLIAKFYDNKLLKFQLIKTLKNNYNEVVPFCYPIICKTKKIRDKIANNLARNSIQVSYLYYPNHLLKKYKTKYNLKITEKIYKNSLLLPLHNSLKNSDLKKVINIIVKSINNDS